METGGLWVSRAGDLMEIAGVAVVVSFTLEVELEGKWPWQRRRTRGRRGGIATPSVADRPISHPMH